MFIFSLVALNYGVLKSNNFDTSKQCYMFYDMGALSTKATVACKPLTFVGFV